MSATAIEEDVLDELPSLPKASIKTANQPTVNETEKIRFVDNPFSQQRQAESNAQKASNQRSSDELRSGSRYDDFVSSTYSANNSADSNYSQVQYPQNKQAQSSVQSSQPINVNVSNIGLSNDYAPRQDDLSLPNITSDAKLNKPIQGQNNAAVNSESSKIDSIKPDSLYFAVLRAKIEDEKRQEEIIRELEDNTSGTLITSLKEHMKKDQYENDLTEVDAKIKNLIQPLQTMEQEWRTLNKEESILSKKLEAIEESIRASTEELKHLMQKKIELKKNLAECNVKGIGLSTVEIDSAIHK